MSTISLQADAAVIARSYPPMSSAQRAVLGVLAAHRLFPGYCELMLHTGLKSYRAVDWVLGALERRAFIHRDASGEDYELTDAGHAALAAAKGERT